jgi:hypothetical protein
MDNTPTVYVTQETPHDFSKAESFGTIEFLTRDDLNNVKGSLHNERLVVDITRKLKDFDESRDWIVIAGSPYVSALVFMLLGRRGLKSVKILRWDNRDYIYVPMHFELRGTYRD